MKQLRIGIDANPDQNDDKKKDKKRKITAENKKTFIQNILKKQKTEIQRLFEWSIENDMNCHQKKWYVSSKFLKKKLF